MTEPDALLIFTADPIEDVLRAGNSAAWRLNIKRATPARYLILARNDPQKGPDHRSAFLIAKIRAIAPRIERGCEPDGRWAVIFDEYAEVDVRDAWNKANQFPVTYVNARNVLKTDPGRLRFQPVPPKTLDWSYSERVGRERKPLEEGITVAEAKRRLAIKFDVTEADIDIIIRA